MENRGMSTTRVMSGVIDFTGTESNGLAIGQMVRRSPEPKYETVCKRCSAHSFATQSQLRNGSARCQASNCGKSSPKRERLAESQRSAAQRQAEAEQAALEASAARMAAETDVYHRPERYAPTTDENRVLTERERLSLRQWKEEQEGE